ncbi:MAG: protein kinase [Myxococcota bacterium]|nr:protein kinase [Myxococcota bacterium]
MSEQNVQAGSLIGRYEVLGQLGAGGMGHVYRVKDPATERVLALKELKFSYPRALHYFKREFRAVASLSHPNLVNLYDLHEYEGRYFYTMELVEGVDIYSFVNRQGGTQSSSSALCEPRRLDRVRQSLLQLLQALDYLHSQGCIHRDIKPANILVDRQGKVRLVDFGVVKEEIPGGEGQSLSQVFGTSTYFSPEQSLSSRVTSATDIYAVGIVLYELLVGRPPFEGDHELVCELHRSQAPPAILKRLPQTDEKLAWICHEMLQKEPASRPSAREVLEFLDAPTGDGAQPKGAFIGRRRERETLHRALSQLKKGKGQLVLVEGEAGVGKRACIEAFCQEARLFGASSFQSACIQRDHVRYRGIDTAIERLAEAYRQQVARTLRRMPSFERDGLVDAFGFLGELLPSSYHPQDVVESEPNLGLFFLLERLAEQRTLVFSVEKIQHADEATLELLEGLMAGGRFPPVLLILSYTPEEITSNSRVDKFIEFAMLHPACRSISLSPFNEEEVSEIVEQRIGVRDERITQYLFAQSGGVPHFTLAMVERLRERQVLEPFNELILRKIEGLERAARRILAVVSLSNSSVSELILEQACGLNLNEVEDGVACLVKTGFIREESDEVGRVDVFPLHPRLMEIARSCVAETRRKVIHEQVALAVESQLGTAEQLEWHWTQAGRPARAARFAVNAAQKAHESGNFIKAVSFFRLALKGDFPPQLQTQLRIQLADGLARRGHYLQAARALEALGEISAKEAQRWRARRYQLFLMAGEIGDLLSRTPKLSERARVILADLLLPLRPLEAWEMLGDTESQGARFVRARFLADTHNAEAIEEAASLLRDEQVNQDKPSLCISLGLARAQLAQATGELSQAIEIIDELLPLRHTLQAHDLNGLRLLEAQAQLQLLAGYVTKARRPARTLLVDARDRGLRGLRASACVLLARVHLEAGELSAAEQLLAEGERCRRAQPRTLSHIQHILTRARLFFYQGKLLECMRILRTLRRDEELKSFLSRREASLEYSVLYTRVCAMTAIEAHLNPSSELTQKLHDVLPLPPIPLFKGARTILSRALPEPEGWLSAFQVIELLIEEGPPHALRALMPLLKRPDGDQGNPQLQGMLWLIAAAFRRASPAKRSAEKNEEAASAAEQQGQTGLRHAGAALPIEAKRLLELYRIRSARPVSADVQGKAKRSMREQQRSTPR